MKKKIIIILGILFLVFFMIFFITLYSIRIEDSEHKEISTVTLSKCIDGDTSEFSINNNTKKYRFLGIDAPEIDTELGEFVSEYTCNILNSAREIKIEYDNYGNKIDKYNRELVWVYVDGNLLQNILLEEGYAKVKYIYANYDYLNSLYKSEDIAQSKRIGLWKDYSPKVYNDYYTITFDYTYKNDIIRVLENNHVSAIKNPYKYGCRFIGWKNGNYLFDLSTKVKHDYNLVATFDC